MKERWAALSNEQAALSTVSWLSSVAKHPAHHFAPFPLFLVLHHCLFLPPFSYNRLMFHFYSSPNIWKGFTDKESATNPQQSHLFRKQNVIDKRLQQEDRVYCWNARMVCITVCINVASCELANFHLKSFGWWFQNLHLEKKLGALTTFLSAIC